MSVKFLYFAWVREQTGISEEELVLPDDVMTVGQLIQWQRARGPEFETAFQQDDVIRVAVDQTHASLDTTLAGAREIAFFPPVTGG